MKADAKDLELLREFEDLKLDQMIDADKRAVAQLKLQQAREIEDFKKSKLFTLELEKKIEKNNAIELANLKEEQRLAQKEINDAGADKMCKCMADKTAERGDVSDALAASSDAMDYALCGLDLAFDGVDASTDDFSAAISESCPEYAETQAEYAKTLKEN